MPEDDRLKTWRGRFGENLKAVRERRDMGQRELAERMAARGHRWHQNTVARTEAGGRTPNALEAHDLADILGVSADRFDWLPPEAAGVAVVGDAATRVTDAFRDAVLAVAEVHAAQVQASTALAGHHGSRYQRVREATESLEAVIVGRAPEDVLPAAQELLKREGRR